MKSSNTLLLDRSLHISSLSVLAKSTEEMTDSAVWKYLTRGTTRNSAAYGGRFETRQCCKHANRRLPSPEMFYEEFSLSPTGS